MLLRETHASLSRAQVELSLKIPFLSLKLHSLGRADWEVADYLDVSVPFSILAHEKTMACPEVKIELAKMKKNLPLERTRPDSALSSKMYLTVHRLTLQVRAMVSQRRRPTRKSCPSVFKTGRFGCLLSSLCPATLGPGLAERRAGLYGSESQFRGRGKGSNVFPFFLGPW